MLLIMEIPKKIAAPNVPIWLFGLEFVGTGDRKNYLNNTLDMFRLLS